MSEDTPPPTPPHQPPLEYWHPTGPAPLHPALLTLCTLAGMGIGVIAIFGVGGILMAGTMNNSGSSALAVGIVAILATIGFVAGLIMKIVRGRALSIDLRRRGWRFFGIGFLIGCGIACLLEGICFTAIGAKS